jgi:hypothetical protein
MLLNESFLPSKTFPAIPESKQSKNVYMKVRIQKKVPAYSKKVHFVRDASSGNVEIFFFSSPTLKALKNYSHLIYRFIFLNFPMIKSV